MPNLRRVAVEVVVDGGRDRPPRLIALEARTTVGRDDDNDISLPDTVLSRHHAEFRERNGIYYVVDLESTNGTYVNDVRVHGERALHNGDVVTVGGTSLIFHEEVLAPHHFAANADGVVVESIVREPTEPKTIRLADYADLVRSQATNALIVNYPVPELFAKVLEAILDSIPAQRAAIMLMEEGASSPTIRATRSRSEHDLGSVRLDIVERTVAEGKPISVRDIVDDADVSQRNGALGHRIRSVMCAPLWSALDSKGRQMLGVLYLDSRADRPPLSDRDLRVLVLLANITATKIENGRLLEESLQKQRIDEDMRRAAEIQFELLPRRSPAVEGYCVCGATEPCRMVGGTTSTSRMTVAICISPSQMWRARARARPC